MNDQGKSD